MKASPTFRQSKNVRSSQQRSLSKENNKREEESLPGVVVIFRQIGEAENLRQATPGDLEFDSLHLFGILLLVFFLLDVVLFETVVKLPFQGGEGVRAGDATVSGRAQANGCFQLLAVGVLPETSVPEGFGRVENGRRSPVHIRGSE